MQLFYYCSILFGSPCSVSDSISLLVRDSFHLSLTLLVRYRYMTLYLGLAEMHLQLREAISSFTTLERMLLWYKGEVEQGYNFLWRNIPIHLYDPVNHSNNLPKIKLVYKDLVFLAFSMFARRY